MKGCDWKAWSSGKGATRVGEAKGAEAPPLARSKLRKKIISFNF